MTKERKEKLYFFYGVFLAALTVAIGILFVAQTWALYRSAPQSPYTRGSVAKFFKPIILPLCVWFAALLGDLVLSTLWGKTEKRLKAQMDVNRALNKVKGRMPAGKLPQAKEVEKREEKFRLIVGIVCGVCVGLAATFSMLFLLDVLYLPIFKGEFFTANNGVVDRLAQVALLALLAFALTCVAAGVCNASRRREREGYLALLADKSAPMQEAEENVEPLKITQGKEIDPKKAKYCKRAARITLLAVGIVLVCVGIFNGGMRDVLMKAINICTQCIGLG